PASLRRASRQRAEVAAGTDDERPAVRVLADGLTDDERVIRKAPALAVIEVLVRVWDEVPARVLADLLRRPERRRRGERRCRRRKQQCRHCETRKCPSNAHGVLHLRVARMAGEYDLRLVQLGVVQALRRIAVHELEMIALCLMNQLPAFALELDEPDRETVEDM